MKATLSKDGRIMATSHPGKAELLHRREAPLETRTDLTPEATKDISGAMNAILADVFALYLKTKNFHWHMTAITSAITICFSMNTPSNSSP